MKRTLMVGLAVFVLGSLLYLVMPATLLLLVRFIQGLGAAALSTVSIALVAKYFPDGRGRAFGIYNAVKGARYVIAPAIGGFLVQQYGFAWIFLSLGHRRCRRLRPQRPPPRRPNHRGPTRR